jgi:hypothetical protein
MRFTMILLLGIANTTTALPRFAIMTGMQCINCHVNPTGGELRNSYGGSDFVNDHLRLIPAHGNDFDFDPKVNDNILIGGDVRFQYLYDGSTSKTTFQSMEGSIYSRIRLYTSTDFYVKYDLVNSAYEAYGLYDFNSGNSYVKVGAFLPSYGIQLDDHTAFTRGGNFGYLQGIPQVGLIFFPDYRDLGVEVGSKLNNFFITVGATNGDATSNINFNSKKAFIGRVEYLKKGIVNFMLGSSAYLTSLTKLYGLHAGLGIDRHLVILSEFDWAKSLPTLSPNERSTAAFVEVSYNLMNGVFFVGRFDYFRNLTGGQIYTRYIIGADIFPIPHFDFMPQIRLNTTNISNAPQPVEALIQSHIYF